MRLSSSSRNPTPSRKPPAAGIQPTFPAASASSMAGMRRLHTEAAIITPAAKPRKTRWKFRLTVLRKKKTRAAPRVVMRKVKPVPPAAQSSACDIWIIPF